MVILRVLQNAFTEVVIKPEEWNMISQAVMQFQQGFGADQTQPGLPQGVPVQGGAPGPQPPGAPGPMPPQGAPPVPPPGARPGMPGPVAPGPAAAPVPPVGPGGVQPGEIPPGGGAPMDVRQMLMQLPEPVKLTALQMQRQGVPAQLIMRFLMQQVQRAGAIGGRGLPPIPMSPAFKGVFPSGQPTQ